MRSETRIGVVIGLVVVVAASLYFWRARHEEHDVILALAPPAAGQNMPAQPSALPPLTPRNAAPAAPAGTPSAGLRPITLAAAQIGPPAWAQMPARPAVLPPRSQIDAVESVAMGPPAPRQPAFSADGRLPGGTILPPVTPLRTHASETLKSAAKSKPPTDAPAAPLPIAGTSVVSLDNRPAPSPRPVEPVDRDREAFLAEYRQDPNRWVSSEQPGSAPKSGSGRVTLPSATEPAPQPGWVASNASETAPGKSADPAAAAPGADGWPRNYVVKRGDTLAAIARRFYGDVNKVRDILEANPKVRGPKRLFVGMTITLPAPTSRDRAVPPPAGSNEAHAAAPGDAHAAEPAPSSAPPGALRTYVVQAGDSFYSIAADQLGSGKRWKDVLSLNKRLVRGDPANLRPGMVLHLPDRPAGAAEPAPAVDAGATGPIARGRTPRVADARSDTSTEVIDATDAP
ncbi:MAG: LysM peptidoglycan-binding domain-containing protein [Phycisphaerae bacterium]